MALTGVGERAAQLVGAVNLDTHIQDVLAAAPDEWLRILLDGEAVNALPGGSR